MSRPKVVAFDIIETVFSLDSLRPRFEKEGLPALALDVWFARALRDAFGLAAAGGYAPFTQVQLGALIETFADHDIEASPSALTGILEGLAELEAHPDAAAAFATVRDAGLRVIALSNGSTNATSELLTRAGLAGYIETIVSVEEFRRSKPAREVYEGAAARVGMPPDALGLVAAHPWDLNGAKAAGLTTAYVARGKPYPNYMAAPSVSGQTLTEAVTRLLGQP